MRPQALVFGEVAELYERFRPGYPKEAFQAAAEYARLGPGDRVLEVGAGTGRASRALLELGLRVTALEPDPAMADQLELRTAGAGNVTVVRSPFESWRVRPGTFRMLLSAQAWHWVRPNLRYRKARRVLEAGGALALLWNYPQPIDRRDPIGRKIQIAYDELAPSIQPGLPGEREGDRLIEMAASGAFEELVRERWTWTVEYGVDEWLGLLRTQSNHRLLPEGQLEALLARLRAAVGAGSRALTTRYTTFLYLGRRRED